MVIITNPQTTVNTKNTGSYASGNASGRSGAPGNAPGEENAELVLSARHVDDLEGSASDYFADSAAAALAAEQARSFILSDPRAVFVQANSHPESVLELLQGISLE